MGEGPGSVLPTTSPPTLLHTPAAPLEGAIHGNQRAAWARSGLGIYRFLAGLYGSQHTLLQLLALLGTKGCQIPLCLVLAPHSFLGMRWGLHVGWGSSPPPWTRHPSRRCLMGTGSLCALPLVVLGALLTSLGWVSVCLHQHPVLVLSPVCKAPLQQCLRNAAVRV